MIAMFIDKFEARLQSDAVHIGHIRKLRKHMR